jgi:hypothetical protein
MPLETGIDENSQPDDLNNTWPLAADPKNEGDGHLRNIKKVLQNFSRDFAFTDLPLGNIPAVFNGKSDESGLVSQQGGIEVGVPMDLESVFVRDPEAASFAPIPFTPIGSSSKARHYKTSAFVTIPGQPVDSETSTGILEFIVPVDTQMFTKTLRFRSNTTVTDARVTIRENDASGKVLSRTSSDQELIAGGGFTVQGTGDTEITLAQYWPSHLGQLVYICLDRYDSVTGTIVKTGFSIKGAAILGQFVPWFNRSGYPYTLVDLQEVMSGGVEEVLHERNEIPTSIGSDTSLINVPVFAVNDGVTYRWKIYILVEHDGGGGAAWADMVFEVNGVPVNHYASGTLGEVYIDASGRAVPFTFEDRFVATADENISLEVLADIQSQAMVAHRVFLTVEKVG